MDERSYFVGNTYVLTSEGQIPIQDVKVGMKVLTKNGTWNSVISTDSKETDSLIKLSGHYSGLIGTDNIGFYTIDEKKFKNKITLLDKTSYLPSRLMESRLYALPRNIGKLDMCSIKCIDRQGNPFPEINNNFWYFIGLWLGDGSFNSKNIGGRIQLAVGRKKVEKVEKSLKTLGVAYHKDKNTSTCIQYSFYNKALSVWMEKTFSRGSKNKELPSWVYGLDLGARKALLQGFIDTDGTVKANKDYNIEISNKKLALGMRLLGESIGYRTYMYERWKLGGKGDGMAYGVNFCKRAITGSDWTADGCSWYRCKHADRINKVATVYNITVEGDNSFIADGFVVANI